MFKQTFDIIYTIFMNSPHSVEYGASYLGLCRFLGVSNGKVQKWREQGQWPKAPDLALLHNKLGLSYKWLVTGEGDPFDEGMENKPTSGESATPDIQAEMEGLRRENVELNVELRGALKELRRLNEERRELEERLKANAIDPGPFAFDPPAESVSAGRPARGVSGADVLGQCNKE